MNLESFKKRLGVVIDLRKSIDPNDFEGVKKATDLNAGNVVDHTKQLNSHPMTHNTRVERYRQTISDQSPLINRTPGKVAGITPKVLYQLPKADTLPGGDSVLVKPYHEAIDPRTTFWQNHPIQGWAEMTNQALWHAADMGHMHQRVHVSEHNMGPGFEKHPAIVIHMHPGAKFAYGSKLNDYEESMSEDLPKIAAMDFLTNNLDRHGANLLVLPHDARDDSGAPALSRLLAIDHGRSFQYHGSHKGIPSHQTDEFHGRISVDPDMREEMNQEGKKEDNFVNYLNSPGIRSIDRHQMMHGLPPAGGAHGSIPYIAEWWPEVRDKVIGAFGKELDAIKDPALREHLSRNFDVRVAKLDDISARPDHFLGPDLEYKDLTVPLYPLNKKYENHNP